MPEQIRIAQRGWLELQNNSYSSEQLIDVDGEEVRVAYDIHDATRVIVRRMDGAFVCEAVWNGNKVAAVPVTAMANAMEERRKRRLNLNDARRRKIEAEGRPVLEAPVLTDFNFSQILQSEIQQAEQHEYHFLQADRVGDAFDQPYGHCGEQIRNLYGFIDAASLMQRLARRKIKSSILMHIRKVRLNALTR